MEWYNVVKLDIL